MYTIVSIKGIIFMPWWMYIYVICLAIIVFVNVAHWFLVKQKFLITVYELLAGLYMIFMIVAYWVPFIRINLSAVNIIGMLSVISVNFYFTVWRKRNIDIQQIFPGMDDDVANLARQFEVVEIAKAIPVLIMAPAYIIGAMLSLDLLRTLLAH
jgi:hypothetical protein